MANNDPCVWSLDTLRVHLIALIDANDKRYEQRFQASQEAVALGFSAQKSAVDSALAAQNTAVIKAEVSTEKRFESVNEFRNTLADQQRNLMPRSEVDVLVHAINAKIDALEKMMDKWEAERAGLKGGWGYAVGAIGFLLTLVTLGVMIMRSIDRVP
jgi:hypothetical protein